MHQLCMSVVNVLPISCTVDLRSTDSATPSGNAWMWEIHIYIIYMICRYVKYKRYANIKVWMGPALLLLVVLCILLSVHAPWPQLPDEWRYHPSHPSPPSLAVTISAHLYRRISEVSEEDFYVGTLHPSNIRSYRDKYRLVLVPADDCMVLPHLI